MIDSLLIKIVLLINAYITFIGSEKNYILLTIISEILNVFRVFPIALGAKVIVDVHREMMKVIILNR